MEGLGDRIFALGSPGPANGFLYRELNTFYRISIPCFTVLGLGFVERKTDENEIEDDLLSDDGASSDDEISVEIRRRQKELKQIQTLNKQRLQKLSEIADRDWELQKVQSQLDQVEAEVG